PAGPGARSRNTAREGGRRARPLLGLEHRPAAPALGLRLAERAARQPGQAGCGRAGDAAAGTSTRGGRAVVAAPESRTALAPRTGAEGGPGRRGAARRASPGIRATCREVAARVAMGLILCDHGLAADSIRSGGWSGRVPRPSRCGAPPRPD